MELGGVKAKRNQIKMDEMKIWWENGESRTGKTESETRARLSVSIEQKDEGHGRQYCVLVHLKLESFSPPIIFNWYAFFPSRRSTSARAQMKRFSQKKSWNFCSTFLLYHSMLFRLLNSLRSSDTKWKVCVFSLPSSPLLLFCLHRNSAGCCWLCKMWVRLKLNFPFFFSSRVLFFSFLSQHEKHKFFVDDGKNVDGVS